MKVSVIMPVYNAETTVLRALDSLRNQTFKPCEIIVINDGSAELLRKQTDILLLDHAHRGIMPA